MLFLEVASKRKFCQCFLLVCKFESFSSQSATQIEQIFLSFTSRESRDTKISYNAKHKIHCRKVKKKGNCSQTCIQFMCIFRYTFSHRASPSPSTSTTSETTWLAKLINRRAKLFWEALRVSHWTLLLDFPVRMFRKLWILTWKELWDRFEEQSRKNFKTWEVTTIEWWIKNISFVSEMTSNV